jgi:WD40 repeat protein
VWSLAFAPDGKTIASSHGPKIALWDLAEGKPRGTLEGHAEEIDSLASSPDGKTVASGHNPAVVLWRLPE